MIAWWLAVACVGSAGKDPPVAPVDDSDPPSDSAGLDSAGPDTDPGEDPPPVDEDQDGHPWGVDCDDADPTVHPGAADPCDGIDADCDGDAGDGAWFLPTVGPPEDLGAAFAAADATPWESPQPGELHLCAGTWRAPLHLRHGVDVVGHGAPGDVVLQPARRRAVTIDGDLVVAVSGLTVRDAGDDEEDGGGVWVGDRAVVTLRDFVIEGAAGRDGGGLFIGRSARVEVDDLRVVGADAVGDGGAGFVDEGATVLLRGVVMEDNLGTRAGGVFAQAPASLRMEGVVWRRNLTRSGIGAVDLEVVGGGAVTVVDFVLEASLSVVQTGIRVVDAGDVVITDAVASIGGYNGAVSVRGCASLELARVSFVGNLGLALSVGFTRATLSELVVSDHVDLRGAAVALDNVTAELSDCRFERNLTVGGAVAADGALSVHDCVFSDNHASNNSGAIDATGNLNLTVDRTSFHRNSGWGGGAVSLFDGSLWLTDVEFVDNVGDRWGGALSTFGTEAHLLRVTASGNSATLADGGFARFAEGSEVWVEDSRFEGGEASDGGAFAVQGALTLTDVTLHQNAARTGLGGAIWLSHEDAEVVLDGVDFGVGPAANPPHDVSAAGVGYDLGGSATGGCDAASGCW